jgi:RNA polymerase sigma factor (sigma-70 family)
MSSGGPSSFEGEFRSLWAVAYRVADRLLTSPSDAEDAAAEALARMHASWGRLDGRPWREAWLVRVTTNVAIDQIRRRRPAAVVWAGIGEPAGSVSVSTAEQVVTRLALVDALQRLPRRQREVVVLRHLAGYPEAAVAEQLRVSVGSVKRHSHRALSSLRGLLDPPAVGGESAGVMP